MLAEDKQLLGHRSKTLLLMAYNHLCICIGTPSTEVSWWWWWGYMSCIVIVSWATTEEDWAWEIYHFFSKSKQVCSLSEPCRGDIASSCKVPGCITTLSCGLGRRVVRALQSWHTQQDIPKKQEVQGWPSLPKSVTSKATYLNFYLSCVWLISQAYDKNDFCLKLIKIKLIKN